MQLSEYSQWDSCLVVAERETSILDASPYGENITRNHWANGDNVGQVRDNDSISRFYCLKDHLGDIRVILNSSGGVDGYNDSIWKNTRRLDWIYIMYSDRESLKRIMGRWMRVDSTRWWTWTRSLRSLLLPDCSRRNWRTEIRFDQETCPHEVRVSA